MTIPHFRVDLTCHSQAYEYPGVLEHYHRAAQDSVLLLQAALRREEALSLAVTSVSSFAAQEVSRMLSCKIFDDLQGLSLS